MVNALAEYAPNIKDIILHRQVLTPSDLESTFGLTEGNIFHGELTIQQLFSLRPAVRWADYTTPIRNYYQCGSGTHPGGGITGSPGEMAAKKDSRYFVMTNYNSIVIGGGVNSLVAATMLGKKGKKVLLLEARNQIGGLASSLEFGDGYKCNMIYDSIKWIDPRVLKDLELENNGLKLIKPDVVRIALGENGKHIFSTKTP